MQGDLGRNPKQRAANVQSAQQAASCGGIRGGGRSQRMSGKTGEKREVDENVAGVDRGMTGGWTGGVTFSQAHPFFQFVLGFSGVGASPEFIRIAVHVASLSDCRQSPAQRCESRTST